MNIDFRTGPSERITNLLRAEVRRFPEVRAAYLYGSRADSKARRVGHDAAKL